MSEEFIATWRKTLAERPDGTHYDGCHLSHPSCALSFATDEIVRLRAVLDAISSLHTPRPLDLTWCHPCDDEWPCATYLLIHPQEANDE
jgi:hypothetical protein